MRAFDFDGVITIGHLPAGGDIVITGRCIDEAPYVYDTIRKAVGFVPPVFFNPIMFAERGEDTLSARLCSANHKATTLIALLTNKVPLIEFLEDDYIQYRVIVDYLEANSLPLQVQLIEGPP